MCTCSRPLFFDNRLDYFNYLFYFWLINCLSLTTHHFSVLLIQYRSSHYCLNLLQFNFNLIQLFPHPLLYLLMHLHLLLMCLLYPPHLLPVPPLTLPLFLPTLLILLQLSLLTLPLLLFIMFHLFFQTLYPLPQRIPLQYKVWAYTSYVLELLRYQVSCIPHVLEHPLVLLNHWVTILDPWEES